MYIKNTTATLGTLALLVAFGCNAPEPSTSHAIERANSIDANLTSAAPPAERPIPSLVEIPELEEKPSFAPELGSMDGLAVKRLVTAPQIEDREPVAASSVFGQQEEKIYAFVEASNESESEKSLLVHFIGPDGLVSGGIELRIPAAAPRWRTWAFTKHARTPGLWRVELRTLDGGLLAALPFEVDREY